MNNIELMLDNLDIIDYFTANGRKDNDCFNCKFYVFKNSVSGCSKKYKVVDWDKGIDFMSIDNPDFDSNYGTYRIDESNNPIICDKFVALYRGDGTKEWKKLKVGKVKNEEEGKKKEEEKGKKKRKKEGNNLGLGEV